MTPEQLQAEAEQLYPTWPFGKKSRARLMNEQLQAAHVACAEKYTAIIEQKDKEIERLLQALDLIIGENDDDPQLAVRNMKNIASDYSLQTPTP